MLKKYCAFIVCLFPFAALASLDDLVHKWGVDLSSVNSESKLAKKYISTDHILKSSAKENTILFFFRSDCGYCHRYAPTLKKFAENYGYSVVSYSLDGRGLSDFPNPRYNPQLAQRLNVMGVPATYIVNSRLNKITTVSFGLSDYGTLSSNMLDALNQK